MELNQFQRLFRRLELILYRDARCDQRVAGAESVQEPEEEPRQEMLILTRKPGEALYIGDHIKVIILGVKGNQVRIGIEAPRDVPIDREEIRARIQRQLGGNVAVEFEDDDPRTEARTAGTLRVPSGR